LENPINFGFEDGIVKGEIPNGEIFVVAKVKGVNHWTRGDMRGFRS